MVSAVCVTLLLESPASPLHAAIPDAFLRRLLTGTAMGLTAIALIYSPWGRRSGAHMNPAVTLSFLRLGKIRTERRRLLHCRAIRSGHPRRAGLARHFRPGFFRAAGDAMWPPSPATPESARRSRPKSASRPPDDIRRARGLEQDASGAIHRLAAGLMVCSVHQLRGTPVGDEHQPPPAPLPRRFRDTSGPRSGSI